MATMVHCPRCGDHYIGLDYCARCRIDELERTLAEAIEYVRDEWEGTAAAHHERFQAVLDRRADARPSRLALEGASCDLAVMAMQSERYRDDAEFRDQVDRVYALAGPLRVQP